MTWKVDYWPQTWVIWGFCVVVVSFSAALGDLLKNTAKTYRPCLFHGLWPSPALLPSLCQIYRWHRSSVDLWCTVVDQAVPNIMNLTAWTLEASVRRKITASPCGISGCAH